ncbi:MAG: hypothetical protein ACK53L_05695, partial [Pirellulaceae bacterium]
VALDLPLGDHLPGRQPAADFFAALAAGWPVRVALPTVDRRLAITGSAFSVGSERCDKMART